MIGDFLANRLKKSIKKNINKRTLSDKTIADVMQEIRITLLEADISLQVVDKLIGSITILAKDKLVTQGLNPEQMLIKIVHQEIIKILGTATSKIK